MEAIIKPGPAIGSIQAPASKSHTQRILAAALLHRGKTIINNLGNSADEIAALDIVRQLGAEVYGDLEYIEVNGRGVHPVEGYITCRESGLAARLFTTIASISTQPVEIQGSGSLCKRPMNTFSSVLPALGVSLTNFTGHVPFTVKGPLVPTSLKIDGAQSSQFLSGLLFALSHSATRPVTIEVTDLKSKPYVDLTLEVLHLFGRPVTHDRYQFFHIDPSLFTQKEDISVDVEGDWSSAAYWLVAGAINGSVKVRGLSLESVQADMQILQLLAAITSRITIAKDEIAIRTSELKSFDFDATDCPDLFPALAILASCTEGDSYISGMHRLYHKESNRAESIAEMLLQLDVPFSIEDDTLCIKGVNGLESATIDSYNDHRIAMAASIAAIRANGPITIQGAEAVNKSYPRFYEHLSAVGIDCTIKQ